TPSPLEQPPVPVRIVPSRPVFFPPPFPPDRFEAYLANSAQLATRETPAPAGSVVTAYFTGLGRVSPEVPAGDPAPASPLAQLIDPPAATLVLFCGATTSELPVSLEFAGLAPRLIGLYQLNFRLPGAYPPTCLDSRGLFSGLLLVGDPVPDSPNGPFVFIRP
ncbi:MAG: hypothetical protein K2Q23_00360, partial [Bryobacteraceae bacterium]|nr:hypothetical protein [Bryobacteraceae bacterium]